jgi:toxin ParE1/3/4
MQVSWTAPALADLDQIQDYVAQESPTTAFRLINDLIDRTEQLLSSNPMAGRRGRVRELVNLSSAGHLT